MARPVQLGITMGDPAGVGPEITAKVLRDMTPAERSTVRVLGPAGAFARAARLVGLADADLAGIDVTDVPAIGPVADGEVSPAAGDVAYRTVAAAVEQAVAGDLRVIVTAPLNKAALHAAGHHYDGHTGLLAALTGSGRGYMLLASERLSTIHVSTHVSLVEAARRATVERVLGTIRAGDHHLRSLGTASPRIAVAGLNPHCGEGGIFGTEEIDTIAPAIALARAEGLDVTGPVPGDTVFRQAYQGRYDLVVAQYHDQGHIPVKLIAFETTVNVTVGLPVQRTSVDHGTAFDIAWTGVADHTNLQAAVAYARRMAPA